MDQSAGACPAHARLQSAARGRRHRGAGSFRRTAGGTRWAQVAATAPPAWSRGVEKIAVSSDGGTVLAATKSFYSNVASTLWRSTDGGATWVETLDAPGTEAAYV